MRQNALARTLKVKPQMVTKWLKGPDTPSADRLFEIADALGVSLDKLMGRVPPGAEALKQLRQQTSSVAGALDQLLPDESLAEGPPKKRRPTRAKRG